LSVAKLPGGVELAYDEFDFGPPWTSREPIVLVHGFTKSRKFWYSWIAGLAERYRVLSVDVRGHNESSPLPADFEMALTPFSDDLAAFLDALGIESAHFVTAEFSSAVAIDFSIRYKRRIKSLILAGFTYNLKAAAVPWLDWIRLVETKGSGEWARTTNHTRLPEDADPAMRAWYIAQQARIPSGVLANIFRYIKDLDLSDRLPEVDVPTLILAGEQAVQAPIADVRKAASLMRDCRLEILPGVPFNVMNGAPQQCVEKSLQFLERLQSRKPG
jgi:pimeloyl-ACP methyl ester carboxylesterase